MAQLSVDNLQNMSWSNSGLLRMVALEISSILGNKLMTFTIIDAFKAPFKQNCISVYTPHKLPPNIVFGALGVGGWGVFCFHVGPFVHTQHFGFSTSWKGSDGIS